MTTALLVFINLFFISGIAYMAIKCDWVRYYLIAFALFWTTVIGVPFILINVLF